MRGRQQFQAMKPLLDSAAFGLRLLPRRVREGLLSLVRHIPGSLGLGLRFALVKSLAKQCGDCVAIFEGVYLRNIANLALGDNVSIHPMCYLDAYSGIVIGKDVSIAHGTTIMSTNHTFSAPDELIRNAPVSEAPVQIGDDVWIGAGVKILSGVSLSSRVVVGAGSVVTRDVPSHSVVAGVPARRIRSLAAEELGTDA